MTTGTKIRTLREQKKMSQEALAYAVGVSQVTIGNWEQGKSIRHAFISKLAVALNVSSDFLLDDSQVSTHTHTHTHTQAIEIKNGVGEFEITIKASSRILEDWHRKIDFLMNKFDLPN